METSPQKRPLTNSVYQESRASQARTASSAFQGYASNRSTPFNSPNPSPSKPTNSTNTAVETIIPKPLNIFKTEHEIIQDAIQEMESTSSVAERPRGGDATALTNQSPDKKRAREEEGYTSEEEEETKDESQVPSATVDSPTKRAVKGLPRRKAAALQNTSADRPKIGGVEDKDEKNPFIVSSSVSSK
ncbi:hypothetical protein CPB86DRAFT_869505 [Serendipita vermifera]|nr:hypothetical protein CPB86DRAFT_869505 [Serendipita vermifera]